MRIVIVSKLKRGLLQGFLWPVSRVSFLSFASWAVVCVFVCVRIEKIGSMKVQGKESRMVDGFLDVERKRISAGRREMQPFNLQTLMQIVHCPQAKMSCTPGFSMPFCSVTIPFFVFTS